MTQALTETAWLRTLNRIIDNPSASDTTRSLAYMLHDIIKTPDDIGKILDAYGASLMERAP